MERGKMERTLWRAQKWLEIRCTVTENRHKFDPLSESDFWGVRGEEGRWLKFERYLERNAHLEPTMASLGCRHHSISESVSKLESCAQIGELRATLESCDNWRVALVGTRIV